MNDNEQSHVYAPSEQMQHANEDALVHVTELSRRVDDASTNTTTDGKDVAVEKSEVNA